MCHGVLGLCPCQPCWLACWARHDCGIAWAQGLESPTAPADDLQEEYGCPICLDLLHSPIVLTCAHRFCWGCLLAHCATNLQSQGVCLTQQAMAAMRS